jgi:hypothetical protein
MASCPACGGTAAEHAARGQLGLGAETRPHEWVVAGPKLRDGSNGWDMVYRCRACGVTVSVPEGTTGDTLRAWQRGKGPCEGVRE